MNRSPIPLLQKSVDEQKSFFRVNRYKYEEFFSNNPQKWLDTILLVIESACCFNSLINGVCPSAESLEVRPRTN